MQSMLRHHLLALMLGVTTVTLNTAFLLDSSALAKNGSDDGGSDSSGDGNDGSSGSGSGDSDSDSDGDHSGSDDSGTDSSGDNDSSDDNSSGNGDDDGDDDGDDTSDDSSSKDKSSKKADRDSARNVARPTAAVSLTPESLAQVRAGTHVVVDQLGRPLEIRVTTVAGVQTIRAKPHGGDARRRPGPITTISVVPNSTVPGSDDGTPDQGPGDN